MVISERSLVCAAAVVQELEAGTLEVTMPDGSSAKAVSNAQRGASAAGLAMAASVFSSAAGSGTRGAFSIEESSFPIEEC